MQKEILPLTSLRFIAALYVFLFHIQIHWPLVMRGGFGHFLAQGACGMSMFFILSGFVLGFRFQQGVSHYKDYAFSRFSRIYPVYFFAAVVTIPWLVMTLIPEGGSNLDRLLFLVFADFFLIQAWFPQLFVFWNNGGSWSISVEMFFYTLFPFLINRFTKLTNKQLFQGLVIFYIVTSLPGISWILFTNNASHLLFYSMPIFRGAEFIIGIICGLLYSRGVKIAHPNLCAIFTATLLYRFLAYGPDYAFSYITVNYATVPLLALLLYCLASVTSGYLYKMLTNPVFVYLGRISYSFYSFQAFILLALVELYKKYTFLPISSYFICLFAFLTLLVISAMSYHFLENKFRSHLTRWYYSKNRKIGLEEEGSVLGNST